MNSRQLELFVKIADFGSLSQAAIHLGITQPALSRIIRDLENELRLPIFYRNGRGVVLTEAGRRLHGRSQIILQQIEQAKSEAIAAADGMVESLAIAVPPTVARAMIGPLARSLSAEFPGIKLRFIEAFSSHLLEGLSNGRVDVGILYESMPAQRLHSEPLFVEQLHVVASVKKPPLPPKFSIADIGKLDLIVPSTPHGLRLLLETAAAKHGVVLSVAIEADSFGSIIDLVGMDFGYAVLPLASIRSQVESNLLQTSPLTDPPVTRSLVLATATNKPPSLGLAKTVRIIKAEVKKLAKEMEWQSVAPQQVK